MNNLFFSISLKQLVNTSSTVLRCGGHWLQQPTGLVILRSASKSSFQTDPIYSRYCPRSHDKFWIKRSLPRHLLTALVHRQVWLWYVGGMEQGLFVLFVFPLLFTGLLVCLNHPKGLNLFF